MSTVTVPAAVVAILRGALKEQVGRIAEEISDLSSVGDEQQRARQEQQQLQRLDAPRALLDAIGWSRRSRERPVAVDLVRHEPALREALEEQLETSLYVQQDGAQLPASRRQRRRAAREIRLVERFLSALEQQPDT